MKNITDKTTIYTVSISGTEDVIFLRPDPITIPPTRNLAEPRRLAHIEVICIGLCTSP